MKNILSLALLVCFSFWIFLIGHGFTYYVPVTTGEQLRDIENQVTQDNNLLFFFETVKNGDPNSLVGLYSESILAYKIIQQPAQNPGFVSEQDGVVTQFKLAEMYNTIGLLAHNYLAGTSFSLLQKGQIVSVVFGDGSMRNYQVTKVESYQALSPDDPYSNFIRQSDLSSEVISSTQLFEQTYALGNQLILQTCIAQGDEDSWGRLFVFAKPVSKGFVWQINSAKHGSLFGSSISSRGLAVSGKN